MIRKIKQITEHGKLGTLVQFIKFGLVGVSNTAVCYILNISIIFLLRGLEWQRDYILANVVSFTISVFWSFYWNNKYVFKESGEGKRNIWKALGKCFLSYGFTGYILENILSYIWIERLGISRYVAPLFNVMISAPVNFLLNKLWAFREEE